jgi:hypothetical protein
MTILQMALILLTFHRVLRVPQSPGHTLARNIAGYIQFSDAEFAPAVSMLESYCILDRMRYRM